MKKQFLLMLLSVSGIYANSSAKPKTFNYIVPSIVNSQQAKKKCSNVCKIHKKVWTGGWWPASNNFGDFRRVCQCKEASQ